MNLDNYDQLQIPEGNVTEIHTGSTLLWQNANEKTSSGTGSVTFSGNRNRNLKSVIFRGSFEQSGSPTPEHPQDIKCNNSTWSLNGSTVDLSLLNNGGLYAVSKLPKDYQEVEYIEATGTQRINTGISDSQTGTAIYRFVSSFSYSDITTRQLNGAQGFKYIGVINGYYQIGNALSGHSSITVQQNVFTPFDITFDTSTSHIFGTVSDVQYDISKTFDKNNINFFLFSLNNGFFSKCKMKEFKFYLDGALIRYFIPCYRKADNAIGMYDKINDVFYTNCGTGTFLKGADVTNIVYDEWDSQTGFGTKRVGVIESYNGEDIPNYYVSSTGDLTVGAKVIYKLDTPIDFVATPQILTQQKGSNTLNQTTGDINNTSVSVVYYDA